MKKFIPVNENDKNVTHLKCEVYYSLGGVNYFTYKNEARGYYASVTPVERRTSYYNGHAITSEGYMMFTGIKQLVKEVSRKGAKSEAEAEKIAETVFPSLIDYVCSKNGLTVAMETVNKPESVETVA